LDGFVGNGEAAGVAAGVLYDQDDFGASEPRWRDFRSRDRRGKSRSRTRLWY
jgi:hypothetical protein